MSTPPHPALPSASVHALPSGTQLAEFELRDVLGEGGFAIVYRAWDQSLRRTVAVKEFMPGALATRAADGRMIAREQRLQEGLDHGLKSFLNEARLLAQFDHPALIRVYRFWEQNGTGYMAMQLCQGRTLRALRESDPQLTSSETWLKHMLSPILDALELLHASQCYHRDISPDNIMILDSGAPMLLDFGAARQALGDATQALTVIIKPGFAPIEQYDSVLAQGPWTDVYSLGAVLYYLITGKPVTASVARLLRDPLPKLAELPGLGISPAFARAIDRALTVHPDERIRSVAEFRDALRLPTFWVEMQRQSVELGALRSHVGNSGFMPLPGSGMAPTQMPILDKTQALPPVQNAGRPPPSSAPMPAPSGSPVPPAPAPSSRARRKSQAPAPAPAHAATRMFAGHKAALWLQQADRRLLLGLGGAAGLAMLAAAGLLLRPAPTPAPAPLPAAAASAPAAASTATAAPAVQPAGAQLLLDISPWGVVYVNGQMQGLTPPLKQLWLPPGTYDVEVRNAGMPSHSQSVTIKDGLDVLLHHEFK